MKKLFLFGFTGIMLMAACSKKDNKHTTPAAETSFIANGVTDVTIERTGTAALGVLVELKGTVQENVKVSVTGLPAGITCDINPASGTPTFTSMLTFKASNMAIGSYPTKIVLTGNSGATKSYDCNIKVVQFANLLDRMAGFYTISSSCSNTSTGALVMKHQLYPNRMVLQSFMYGNDVEITVDSVNHTLTIPSQTINSGTVGLSGTGQYTDNSITLSFYRQYQGGGHDNCTSTLTR